MAHGPLVFIVSVHEVFSKQLCVRMHVILLLMLSLKKD